MGPLSSWEQSYIRARKDKDNRVKVGPYCEMMAGMPQTILSSQKTCNSQGSLRFVLFLLPCQKSIESGLDIQTPKTKAHSLKFRGKNRKPDAPPFVLPS